MKTMTLSYRSSAALRRQTGISLIEVLIALLVMTTGALALARFSGTLIRHAESARHRTEASMLAQAKLEELRAFTQVLGGAGASYQALAGGHDQPEAASNTRFERRWQIDGAASDPQRRIDVQIDWTDRDGRVDPTGVRLSALVARAEPADAGRLALLPADPHAAHRPLDRSLAIPWQALRLSGANRGRSALPWRGASGGYLVFNDATGRVTDQCEAAPGDGTDIPTRCRPIDALMLTGHLSGPQAAEAIDVAIVQTQHLVAAPECWIGDAVSNADGRILTGLRAYRCLVRPGDHDGNAGTPRTWSGRAIVLPQPTGTQAVCRFSAVGVDDAPAVRNEDHPAVYTMVTRSLQHQNFALINAGACPEGSVRHQPA